MDDPREILGRLETPPPPSEFAAHTVAAAAPLLALHARRTSARAWLRPLAVALLPLPLILVADGAIVFALHALLSLALPSALTTYFVAQYALFVLLLLALTYAAVPILVDRQARGVLENRHA
jgi:hypothetical protein